MKKERVWYKEDWVIAIFVIMGLIMLVYVFQIFDNGFNFNKEGNVKRTLKADYGYEVIDIGVTSDNTALLEMKSLGSRREQVWDGLIKLSFTYPDAETYLIIIHTPTKTCSTSTLWTNWKSWIKSSQREKVFLDINSELEGINFYQEVLTFYRADRIHWQERGFETTPESIKRYEQEQEMSKIANSEVDSLLLWKVVENQIKESETCY